MAFEAVIKKWGNSYAVIIPSEVVKEKHLKENDSMILEGVKKLDVAELLRKTKLPQRKMTGQEFKDMARAGWR